MTYSEKLKDPRWQKKRLEVMNAAGFKCATCKSQANTLHVHHCYYEKGLQPWEYPISAYLCLCENCHEDRQQLELRIQKELAKLSFQELDEVWCNVFYAIENHGVLNTCIACDRLGA